MDSARWINLSCTGGDPSKKRNLLKDLQSELEKIHANFPIDRRPVLKIELGPEKWRNRTVSKKNLNEKEFIEFHLCELFKYTKEKNESSEWKQKEQRLLLTEKIILQIFENFNFFTSFTKETVQFVIENMKNRGLLKYTDLKSKVLEDFSHREFKLQILNTEPINPNSILSILIKSTYKTRLNVKIENDRLIYEKNLGNEKPLEENFSLDIDLKKLLIKPGFYKLKVKGYFQIPTIKQLISDKYEMSYEDVEIPEIQENFTIKPLRIEYEFQPSYILISTDNCICLNKTRMLNIKLTNPMDCKKIIAKLNDNSQEIPFNSFLQLDLNKFNLKFKSYDISLIYEDPISNLMSCESEEKLITFKLIGENDKKFGFMNLSIEFSGKVNVKIRLIYNDNLILEEKLTNVSSFIIRLLDIYKNYNLEIENLLTKEVNSYQIAFKIPDLPSPDKINLIFESCINKLIELNKNKLGISNSEIIN